MREASVVADIPFRRIPNHSELFLEYLDRSSSALKFYQRPPVLEEIEQLARRELPHFRFPRHETAAILRRQNEALGANPLTMENIDALEEDGCAAVVTGQQVGLFAGPLYTVYKAITAVRLTEELRARQIQAVPIFWMESEDHDMAEVTQAAVFEVSGAVRKKTYLDRLFGEPRASAPSVGSLTFQESVRDVVGEFVSALPASEYRDEAGRLLESTYRPGTSLTSTFGRLMTRFFRDQGLILFDSQDRDAKPLLIPLFQKALHESSEIQSLLRERSRTLKEAGFHAQVSIPEESTVLFLQSAEERKALIRQQELFGTKNSGVSFSLDDLLRLGNRSPERFSPNVLLRPIVQDHLFPTVAYVGGPAEIAYFAQAEVLYRQFGRPMPVIWPRSSFTLLDQEILSAMRRMRIGLEDCFLGKDRILEKMVESAHDTSTARQFKILSMRIASELDELRPAMETADISLGPALELAKRKILHNMGRIQASLMEREANQSGTTMREADIILGRCYPNNKLQERELGVFHFAARHGLGFLQSIYRATEIGNLAHRVLALDSDGSS